MSNRAETSELERALALLASFAHIEARRASASRAPKRPRRLSTSSSNRLQRIRPVQRVAVPTNGGRVEVAIQGRFASADLIGLAVELIGLAEDVEPGSDPRELLAELLTTRETA
jgi:hypothetical protein